MFALHEQWNIRSYHPFLNHKFKIKVWKNVLLISHDFHPSASKSLLVWRESPLVLEMNPCGFSLGSRPDERDRVPGEDYASVMKKSKTSQEEIQTKITNRMKGTICLVRIIPLRWFRVSLHNPIFHNLLLISEVLYYTRFWLNKGKSRTIAWKILHR